MCHCYVQLEELPGVHERRHRLQVQHGFVCECPRCEAQLEAELEA